MKLMSVCKRTGVILICFASLFPNVVGADLISKNLKPDRVFQMTNLWTAHFKFTREQWEAMEPKGGLLSGLFRMFGGGGAGRGGPGGVQMPQGFGAGMFLAPGFLKAGDRDGDKKLSKEEFLALGEKWFSEWDTNKSGTLKSDQVRTGLNSALGQGNMGLGFGGMFGGNGRGFLQATEGKRNGLSSVMGIEFNYVHADLEFENLRFQDVAVRYKGNGTFVESRASLKRSLKVDLNEFAKNQKLAGLTKLNFHNNVTDPGLMNEVLAFRLFHDAGVPAPRTAYTKLHVTVPDKHERRFFGVYSLVENIDNAFADERFGSKKGAILKPSTPSPFTDLGDDWKNYAQIYDPKTELTPAQQQRVIKFCKLMSTASDEDFAAKVGSYIDLEEFARYMAVTVYLSSMDSILGIGQNYYLYIHPKTELFQFIPWDQDHSFADFFVVSSGALGTLSIHHPWQGEIRFLERMFNVEAFKKLYLARLDEFAKTIFKPERFLRQVEEIAAALRPAVKEESEEKLSRFDKVVAGEAVGGGFMGLWSTPIRTFVPARTQSVMDQLAGTSEGKIPGAFPFGGFGGRGGGPPGGAGGFGPATFVSGPFLKALDQDKNAELSRDEFVQGFAKWYDAWSSDSSAGLTEDQLRAGINKELPLPLPPAGFEPPGGPPRGQ